MLVKHYGFTDPASRRYAAASEELDFIINYDIKYRMGMAGEEADE